MNPTNGFHPLWMLLLLPIYFAAGADPETALRWSFVLVAAVAAITALLAFRAFLRLSGRTAAWVGVGLLLQPFAFYPLVNGLETGILVLFLFLLIERTLALDLLAVPATLRRDFLLGTLLGLTFLARLDSVFLLPGLVVVLGVRALRAPAGATAALGAVFAKLVRIGAGFALLAMPYLAWNFLTFGHLVPISGAIKSTAPTVSFEPSRLHTFHTLYGLLQVLAGAAALLLIALLGRMRNATQKGAAPAVGSAVPLLVMLGIGNLLHLAYSLLFVAWGGNWWHHASYLPGTLACLTLAFAMAAERMRRPGWLTAAVAGLLVVAAVVGVQEEGRRRGTHRDQWLASARWARDHLPAGSVVGMTDCGIFAYFSQRPTMNLDGIINGYAYQDALRDHHLTAFLGSCHVTHIGGHAVSYENGRYVIELPARLHRSPGAAIVASPGAEVYCSPPFPAVPGTTSPTVNYVLWDRRRVHVIDDVTKEPPRTP
jgi:hypothetical protein